MGGPVGYRTEDQNRRSAPSAVAQAEPPVLLSTPVRPGGAGAIRAAPPGQHLGAKAPGENVCYLRSLGTDEPLTSMNEMARGRATSSLSPEPTQPTEP